jgi:hypothetical protein
LGIKDKQEVNVMATMPKPKIYQSKYTIEKIVIVQLAKDHIPYIYYAILRGPKGGRTFIDYYNLERLVKPHVNSRLATMSGPILDNYLISYARKQNILEVIHPNIDEIKNEEPDTYKCVKPGDRGLRNRLIRNDKPGLYRRIALNFEFDNED